jgi:MarR family transcriptional regulator, lower aerobic nicotinate degradation pathway regulator
MVDSDNISKPLAFENSIGFLLRRALQRHTVLFTEHINHDITRAQMAAMAWIYTEGPSSQNLLGRKIAVDASTIKGVVDRLRARGLLVVRRDTEDKRCLIVELSAEGRDVFEDVYPIGSKIAESTLEPLTAEERETLFALLRKLG